MRKVAIANGSRSRLSNYISAIERVGALASELPRKISDSDALNALSGYDALVLTGGGDVDPRLYGEENAFSSDVDPVRDDTEIALLRAAKKSDLPTLGICRGIQLANVAFGGTLWQDLEKNGFQNHFLPEKKLVQTHFVSSVSGGILPDIFGESVSVNSIHHQAVKTLAKGLSATLISSDGVVEGIEDKTKRFFIFVQFHPELLLDTDERFLQLFRRLVDP